MNLFRDILAKSEVVQVNIAMARRQLLEWYSLWING